MDKRVCFDFDRFHQWRRHSVPRVRLDILRHDIADDELTSYIVRDMRLLMGCEVGILRESIIEEAPKRPLAIEGKPS